MKNKMIQKLGLVETNGLYFIERDGFKFQIVEAKNGIFKVPLIVMIFNRSLSNDEFKTISKGNPLALRGVLFDAFKPKNAIYYGLMIDKMDKLNTFLDKQVAKYNALGLKQLTEDITGSDITDGHKYMNFTAMSGQILLTDVEVPVNLAEFEAEIKLEEAKLKDEAADVKKYPVALLMALVGAFVGAIPSLILYSFGYMHALVFMIIPLVSFTLYKQFKGPKTIPAIIFIGIFGAIAAVGTYMYGLSTIAEAYDVPFNLLFEDAEFVAIIIEDVLFTILFYAIGFYFSWRFMYKETIAKRLKDIQNIK